MFVIVCMKNNLFIFSEKKKEGKKEGRKKKKKWKELGAITYRYCQLELIYMMSRPNVQNLS